MVDESLIKNYENCGNAIILDAMNEYMDALRVLAKPNASAAKKAEAQDAVKRWKLFLRSNFYDAICQLDGEVLEVLAQRKAREGKQHFKSGKLEPKT